MVRGTVTDGSLPLPGVTIIIKGKKNTGVISDYNGQYSLSVSASDTLVVSFIGFRTLEVPIAARNNVNITLKYDSTTLQEVKVNAGYYSVKESERTGSIARITSKDIETQPVTNLLAAMQGRMAGVSITQSTGVSGGGFDIKIRGQNSLRPEGNAPLYVIDGVPYSSEPIGNAQVSTVFTSPTSPLNGINPDQVESIEVLKDADATSIYGSRGANGVVLITTKRGKSGKTSFSLNASTGGGTVSRFPKLMNTQEYLSMRRQAFANDKISVYPASAYDINGTWDHTRYTNWQKELMGRTALFTDIQGTITGGSQNTNFLLSGNYHNETTVYPGDFKYKKGGSQFSLNHISEDQKFKIQFSSSYTIQDNDQPSLDLTSISRTLAPNAPALYNLDGSLNWAGSTWQNPLRNLAAEFKSNTKDFIANAVLSYELLPGLFAKSSVGYSGLNHFETRTAPSTIFDPKLNYDSSYSILFVNNTSRNSWVFEPQVNWEKNIKYGLFNFLVGATFQNQSSSQLVQSGYGFSSNSLIYNLSSAATVRALTDIETRYKYQAFFGRANYSLKDRYILNVTGRRDGSSRFGPGSQFAFFGAVGTAWLFSKENFVKDSSWMSFGKLRASYGTTGSDQIGDYKFLDTYSSSGVQYNGTIGLQPTSLFNPEFAWEVNKKLETAIEMGFLQDRLFLTAAWYRNRSSNQLVGIPMPSTTGFSSLQANLNAEVENSGWEFTFRSVNFSSKNFQWITSLNLTFSRNKLLSFPGLTGSTYSQRYRIGEPLNMRLLYDYKGIDPASGVYLYTDLNNDGRITAAGDRQIVADFNPDYFGGIQNQLSYKGLKLDFLFQFVKQQNLRYSPGAAGQMYNQLYQVLDSWQNAEDSAQYQIFTAGYNTAAVTAGSRFGESTGGIADASYIRLKNISLSYDLPLNLKSQCRIIIQGQNLLTITRYKDGDPEFINAGFLPPLKVLTAGVQLTF
ncbi:MULTISPECIES: SusC/RagA family TonB-linked outer membrane protein [Flavobacterium]|uniref:SusC/RagA family TonB-linked outer membrane protein n=1 Tax=Flavobacterium TaxID=237 RepID=UPI0029CAC5C6|nr:SusC/RagA family TonB-linked outer membrane protein [Flavobacterium sp. N503310]